MEGEWRMRSHARGTEVEVTLSLELQSPSRLQPRVWLRMPWTSGGVTGSRRNEPAFLPHPPPPLPPSSSSTLQPPLSYIFGGLAPVCSPWAAAGPRAAGGLSGQKTADQAIQVVADPRPTCFSTMQCNFALLRLSSRSRIFAFSLAAPSALAIFRWRRAAALPRPRAALCAASWAFQSTLPRAGPAIALDLLLLAGAFGAMLAFALLTGGGATFGCTIAGAMQALTLATFGCTIAGAMQAFTLATGAPCAGAKRALTLTQDCNRNELAWCCSGGSGGGCGGGLAGIPARNPRIFLSCSSGTAAELAISIDPTKPAAGGSAG